MNIERLSAIVNKIKANPECWDQREWHCGTKHCLFGHAQIASGREPDTSTVRRDARIFLDLSIFEADYLSNGNRSMEDFEYLIATGSRFSRAGYDRDGFDSAGYDRDGYGRAGYDRAGYNRAGFDSAGYDRDGLDANNKPREAA